MPPGFLWGAATAAHQNEGGNRNNQWAAWEAAAGPHPQRRQGRQGDRLVEPGDRRGRLRPRGRAGDQQPAPVGRMEPHRAGAGAVRPDRAAQVRRDDRPAARPRHRADGHAAPLHRPAVADRAGRVGESQGRGLLRPLHGARRRGAGRPGDVVVYGQRADRLCVQRLHGRRIVPAGREQRAPGVHRPAPDAAGPRPRLPDDPPPADGRAGGAGASRARVPARKPGQRRGPPHGRAAGSRRQPATSTRRSPAASCCRRSAWAAASRR